MKKEKKENTIPVIELERVRYNIFRTKTPDMYSITKVEPVGKGKEFKALLRAHNDESYCRLKEILNNLFPTLYVPTI